MATVYPFRALRPLPERASDIAAVPYDVVTTDEARTLADGNPLSFLHVSRPEIELPPDTDPYSDAVYARAAANFASLRDRAMVVEDTPAVYFYRLAMGGHVQTGVAACFSLDEYDHDIIKKHERTRRDKEDDRTKHMLALHAQTGPVLLAYPASSDAKQVSTGVTAAAPLFDFKAADGIRHTLWKAGASESRQIVEIFKKIPSFYIADGHHRAASAARTRAEMRRLGVASPDLGDGADANTLLAVAFPHDEMQILPYNRVVKDLGGLSPEAFLARVGESFTVRTGQSEPARKGDISMYLAGRWQTLQPHVPPDPGDPIASLDVSVLQDRLLAPVLNIVDVRTDKRIDFVGGARGTRELERQVDSGRAAVAFSMYPVSVSDLMSVADAGSIMPPKSTWFEPKLRDGLLIHLI